MNRFFVISQLVNRFKNAFFCLILVLMFAHPSAAMEFAVQGGAGFTTQVPNLSGLAFSANMRGDPKTNSWFSDTQLINHWFMANTDAKEGDASATITFRSWELNWFYLLPIKTQNSLDFFWGPGIGYGVAEVDEDISSRGDVKKDPSKFFSADDIHYGTLSLKFGFNWSNKTCEGRLSSFGGLIGTTVLCGIVF